MPNDNNSKKPVRPKKAAGKAKYVSPKNAPKQKGSDKPLVLHKNSGGREGMARQTRGPIPGKDTSTPREEDNQRPQDQAALHIKEDNKRPQDQSLDMNEDNQRPQDQSLDTKEDNKRPQDQALYIKAVAEAQPRREGAIMVQEAQLPTAASAGQPEQTESGQKEGEQEDEEIEVDPQKYPSVCRRCYINFSTRMSPVCNHRYCDECYDKCQGSVTYNDGKEEESKFVCFNCAKTENQKGSLASFQKPNPCLEQCAKEVEKVFAFGSYAFLNPQKLVVSSDGKSIIVVDDGCGKILRLNLDGEMHQFSYLKNYQFQGGLSLTKDDTILLSLKNDKYTSISFYTMSGTFKFSAFLDSGSQVPHIVTNSENEIIALDSVANTLDIISEQKRIHKQMRLAESEVFHPVALAAHPDNDNVYILDGNNHCISVFDPKYNFMFKFGVSVGDNDKGVDMMSGADRVRKLLIDADGIIFRVMKTRIVAHGSHGQFMCEAITFMPNPNSPLQGIKPVIRDACLAGPGRLAVLMVGGSQTGEIRMYAYHVASKFKNNGYTRKVSVRAKSCCVLS